MVHAVRRSPAELLPDFVIALWRLSHLRTSVCMPEFRNTTRIGPEFSTQASVGTVPTIYFVICDLLCADCKHGYGLHDV